MNRRISLSFCYRHDLWRAHQVRNSWLLSGDTSTLLDAAGWLAVEAQGLCAVRARIDHQLAGTDVTVVLIGEHTSKNPYVLYELQQSYRRGNGLLGLRIHPLRDQAGQSSLQGRNPLDDLVVETNEPTFGFFGGGKFRRHLSSLCETYDWLQDDGRANLPRWIEEAAGREPSLRARSG
jgi:hypothetical protein